MKYNFRRYAALLLIGVVGAKLGSDAVYFILILLGVVGLAGSTFVEEERRDERVR